MSTPHHQNLLKVAVVGASGIGKNHARWFSRHGCDVVAFVGTSPQSIERTQKILEDGFGFAGRGYTDLNKMLEREKPDAVCISSPPPLHCNQTLDCIDAGAHVLCEKPLVYDAAKSRAELHEEAAAMVQKARDAGVLLGAQMQYGLVAPIILAMADVHPDELQHFEMVMETKNIKDNRSYEQIWVDLAPHPLSVLQKIAPGAGLEADSIECSIGERETSARFNLCREEGKNIECQITTRFDPQANPPRRCFSFNGRSVEYSGRNNADGEFCSYLSHDGREEELPDFVDLLIGNFTDACRAEANLFVTGEDGAQNIDWVLQIADAGQRV